jgi:MFS family permease
VTLQVSGLMMIPLILLLFLMKDSPKDMGLRPYGENQHLSKRRKNISEWAGYSLQELMRRPSFYLMIINTFLCVVALYMTSPFLVSYLCDCGYNKIDASSYYSVLLIVLAFAKLAGGWFSDKFGAKALVYIFISCTAIAQFLLLDVSNPTTTYIAAVFLGIGASTATVLIPLLTLPLFGFFGSMQINSIMISIPSLSNLISDTVANAIYDVSGSYRTYFPVLIGINIFLLFSYTVLFRFAKKDRKDFEKRNAENTAIAK